MTLKTKSIIQIALTIILVFFIPQSGRDRIIEKSETVIAFENGIIRCVIDIDNDMYDKSGLKAGFNYEMLSRFAEKTDRQIEIMPAIDSANYQDSLIAGSIDILAKQHHKGDSLFHHVFKRTRNIDHYNAWYLRADKTAELKEINQWISTIIGTREYNDIRNRFYSNYSPSSRLEKGTLSHRLSPYDNLIKKYAATIGWDWKMLAAVIYQESRFSINSRSYRGAYGLMQILPSTAAYYGIYDLLNPEENIKAGTKHLARLQKAFSGEEFTCQERINFTLASYNAGEGRIADCRLYAESKELDSTKWDEILKIIPDMRYYTLTIEDNSVRTGQFRGSETINYVKSILEIYDAFCIISGETNEQPQS